MLSYEQQCKLPNFIHQHTFYYIEFRIEFSARQQSINVMSVTFIKVFQLHQFIKNQANTKRETEQNLETSLCLENDSRCRTIISLLKQNRGLTNYLSYQFQKSDISLISTIFDHCCNIYSSEFENILVKLDQNSVSQYQYQVWKQPDLVPFIFKFLDLNELSKCSKVNCSWLYHAYNPSSMPYSCHISRQYEQLECSTRIRSRQRMAAVRCMKIDFIADLNGDSLIFHLKRLICLNIDVLWNTTTCSAISAGPIAHQLQALHIANIRGNNAHGNKDCLSLANLKCLFLAGNYSALLCPILELPLCQTLTLKTICLDDDWCQKMSCKKYLQNVKKLVFKGVSFKCRNESIKNLASSLTKIEYVHFGSCVNMQMLLLWKYLKGTIDSNKAHVSINQHKFDKPEFNLLHFIQSNRLKINHLYSLDFDDSESHYGYNKVKELIVHSNKYLQSMNLMFFKHQCWNDFCDLLITNNGNSNSAWILERDKISLFPNLLSIVITGLAKPHEIPMSTSSIYKFLTFVHNQQQFKKCGVSVRCLEMKYCSKDLENIRNTFQIIRNLIDENIPVNIMLTINKYTLDSAAVKNQFCQLQKDAFFPIFGTLLKTLDDIHVDPHSYYDPVSTPLISLITDQYKRWKDDKNVYCVRFIARTAILKREIIGGHNKLGDAWKIMIARYSQSQCD